MEAIFNMANKPSDFADRAPPLPNIFIGKIYSPPNHLPTKCHAHLSFAKRMNRTSMWGQGISKIRKLKDTTSIISVVAGLRCHLSSSKSRSIGRREGVSNPSVEGGGAGSPSIFLPAIIIIIGPTHKAPARLH